MHSKEIQEGGGGPICRGGFVSSMAGGMSPDNGGASGCPRLRSAMTAMTQPVQVGSMSTPGMNSITNVGNNSKWKPIVSIVNAIAINFSKKFMFQSEET
jgi:hypothetical protein